MVNHYEDDLQKACTQWIRYQHPSVVWFAIPNGGKRNAREAARLKAQGVLAGVPDGFMAMPSATSSGLFVEFKIGKNKLSAAQAAIIELLRDVGYKVVVCRSLSEFMKAVTEYLTEGGYYLTPHRGVK